MSGIVIKDRRALRAMAIMLAAVALLAVTLLVRSTPSGAAEYPPTAPTTAAQSTCATPASSDTGTASCGQEAITIHKPSKSPSDNSSNSLASTGFATATAIAVVVVLFGVGGICLVAGRRRRHA